VACEDQVVMDDDSLLPLSRAGLWLLFVLAVLNAGFLYLLPQLADTDYAWSIAPQINAAVIGAGYLAGVVGTGLGLWANRWSLVRPLAPGLIVLAVFLLAATAIDGDRFEWDYLPTWVWTVVYAAVPIGLALVWRWQGGVTDEPGIPGARRGALALTSAGFAVVLLAVGVLLFANVDFLLDAWPWELTPLVARVVGGWYLLAGTVLLAAIPELARPRGAPIAYATVGAWCAFVLLLPALYSESARDVGEVSWWVALHAAVLAVCVWGYATRPLVADRA
jgi:hypothetical protein